MHKLHSHLFAIILPTIQLAIITVNFHSELLLGVWWKSHIK